MSDGNREECVPGLGLMRAEDREGKAAFMSVFRAAIQASIMLAGGK